jgi:hypothetical protein
MKAEEINALVNRYNAGEAAPTEIATIESLLERGDIDLGDLHELKSLDQKIMKIESPSPSTELDDRFYATLALEKKKKIRTFSLKNWFAFPEMVPKLGLASLTFTLGVAAGYFILQRPEPQAKDLSTLTQEVSNLKEMMMLSLLEKESATERLRAVSMSEELDQASQTVTSALLKTLNQDENINVRLAALEALKPYSTDGKVRTELVLSITKQDSPLVQIALAELMVSLQEKSSVKEFQKLLQDENTPKEVKSKIRQRIEVLI